MEQLRLRNVPFFLPKDPDTECEYNPLKILVVYLFSKK
jgi:hypothetical protein